MRLYLCCCMWVIVWPLLAQEIKSDTQWSHDIVISETLKVGAATISVDPGVTITFEAQGRLLLGHGAALIAKGTLEKPITIQGQHSGIIDGYGAELLLQHCHVRGLSAISDKKPHAVNLSSSVSKSIKILDCVITDCSRLYLKPGGGSVTVARSHLKAGDKNAAPHIGTYGKGQVVIDANMLDHASIGLGGESDGVISNNIVISGSIGGWRTKSLLIEGNYVHQPGAKGSYCVPGATGILRNNVFRGGSWTTAKITGEMTGNVLISLPHQGFDRPDTFDEHCTHEHICGMGAGSVVRRNIFIGASYGGVMGLGTNTCSGLEFSNNTLDMKNRGRCVMTNHLPEAPSKDIKIRNNIFMRCTGVLDEAGVKNAVSILDHNLWSEAPSTGDRYSKIFIDGMQIGDEGFGKNDLPTHGGTIAPRLLVENPNIEFPYTDEAMLAGEQRVEDILRVYREAYALVTSSPAINAGQMFADCDGVTDGKPDIGALERQTP